MTNEMGDQHTGPKEVDHPVETAAPSGTEDAGQADGSAPAHQGDTTTDPEAGVPEQTSAEQTVGDPSPQTADRTEHGTDKLTEPALEQGPRQPFGTTAAYLLRGWTRIFGEVGKQQRLEAALYP
jgi:hypothetical protein